ncbi:MAG: hypothetical protein KME25_08715 [Symplocastrum torsivum CPER-KK1]|uniref:Uncharacterized protein n=1 Tax=Symplocastrum torsivum CPER-KK1 TaxID=450513 RepID=A0A951PJM8_9CYAN|nr:hypothetical protein [Symplocastrum torsivum CPER-KK1]
MLGTVVESAIANIAAALLRYWRSPIFPSRDAPVVKNPLRSSVIDVQRKAEGRRQKAEGRRE